MIEDRDVLQPNATIIGNLLDSFNSVRLCIDERLKSARLWFKMGVIGIVVYLEFISS